MRKRRKKKERKSVREKDNKKGEKRGWEREWETEKDSGGRMRRRKREEEKIVWEKGVEEEKENVHLWQNSSRNVCACVCDTDSASYIFSIEAKVHSDRLNPWLDCKWRGGGFCIITCPCFWMENVVLRHVWDRQGRQTDPHNLSLRAPNLSDHTQRCQEAPRRLGEMLL